MMKRLFFLLCCTTCCLFITAQDTAYHGKAGITDVEGSDPGLFIVMMIVLAFFVACLILISVVITGAACILAIFTAVGIVSISFIAGLYQRSLKAAFKWLYTLSAGVAGSVCGVPAALLVNALFHLSIRYALIISAGIIAGFVCGLLCGRTLFYFTVRALGYMKNRIISSS